MGTRFRLRHVRNVAAVIAATAVLAAVGLHTPMVRARALTFLLARLAESGFIARADRLDYNLVTRTVRLSGLTLAVPSAADTPFLAAREVTIALPWSAIRGPFSLDRVAWNAQSFEHVRQRSANAHHQVGTRSCCDHDRQKGPLADGEYELLSSHVDEVRVPVAETRRRPRRRRFGLHVQSRRQARRASKREHGVLLAC